MYIANNVLEHYLRNVYWIGGTACGSKTTMAQLLAERHDLLYYNADNMYHEHRKLAIPTEQPAMCHHFADAETYFSRPVDEYVRWLCDINHEELSMIVCDLIRLAEKGPVILEGHFAPDLINPLTQYRKAVFLYAQEDIIRKDYFAREDKAMMLEAIQKLTEPEKIVEHVLDVTVELSRRHLKIAERSGVRYLVRDSKRTIEDTLQAIEQHFALN